MKPLPPCSAAVNQSLVDDSWNRQNVQWTRATVWAAQNAAHVANQMSSQCEGLQRCAACAAEINSASKPVCSRCKKVYFCDRDCQKAAFPVHKHFCQTPEAYKLMNSVESLPSEKLALAAPLTEAGSANKLEDTTSKYLAAYASLFLAERKLQDGASKQIWDHLQMAVTLAKQLKDWNLQSLAFQVLVTSCREMGGATTSSRNVQCWDEALGLARKHHDILLEAMTTKCMGGVAKQFGEFSALEESRQLWLAMMKACRVRGPAGEPGLHMTARRLAITLSSIAEGKTRQQKCEEAEVLFREALLYLDEAGHDIEVLEDKLSMLRSLANLCQVHPASGELGGQEWHDKAAVYRQHAIAVLKRMGRSVAAKCAVCHKALNADKASDRMTPWSAVIVQECGHILHIMCLMTWQGKPGQQCPTCVVRSKREK